MRWIVIAGALTASAWAQKGNPLAGRADTHEKGKETYLGSCSACHGANGEGGQGPSLVNPRALARLDDRQLFDVIRNGLKGTMMPPFAALPDDKTWQVAAYVRGLGAPAIASKVTGDPEAGRALFAGKAGCTQCHAVDGRGGVLGPDLSNAGSSRTQHQLRESLLKPSERIEEGFQGTTVTFRDGRRVDGIAKNADNYSLQLLDASGRLHLIWKRDTTAVSERQESLMPATYSQTLAAREIEDMIAFLSRLSVRRSE